MRKWLIFICCLFSLSAIGAVSPEYNDLLESPARRSSVCKTIVKAGACIGLGFVLGALCTYSPPIEQENYDQSVSAINSPLVSLNCTEATSYTSFLPDAAKYVSERCHFSLSFASITQPLNLLGKTLISYYNHTSHNPLLSNATKHSITTVFCQCMQGIYSTCIEKIPEFCENFLISSQNVSSPQTRSAWDEGELIPGFDSLAGDTFGIQLNGQEYPNA